MGKKKSSEKLVRFLEKSIHQHGFSLINLPYNELNHDKKYIGTFMGRIKHFNLVNHHILIEKLYIYGIHGKIMDWYLKYICTRSEMRT